MNKPRTPNAIEKKVLSDKRPVRQLVLCTMTKAGILKETKIKVLLPRGEVFWKATKKHIYNTQKVCFPPSSKDYVAVAIKFQVVLTGYPPITIHIFNFEKPMVVAANSRPFIPEKQAKILAG